MDLNETLQYIMQNKYYSTAFQPIVNSKDIGIYGVEALTKIQAPGVNNVEAVRLLSIAGKLGIRAEVDELLRDNAIDTYSKYPFKGIKLFLNCVADQLEYFNFNHLLEYIKRHNLRVEDIVLEITEEAIDSSVLLNFYRECRACRIKIALDDMVDDEVLLNRILVMYPNYIKIDRSLVSHIDVTPSKQHSLSNIISFAASISALVVIESAETHRELETCRSLGATLMQCYKYYRPMPVDKLWEEVNPDEKK
jgi:EAL domain-containing protein (putative c-di-GMP-specific phosphodiesterase class I)